MLVLKYFSRPDPTAVRRWMLLLIFIGMNAMCHLAAAQVGVNLTGVVTDRSGAVVAGAVVKVTDQRNGQVKAVTTGEAAGFHIFNLPPLPTPWW
jgi:hypothetical protein